MQRSLHPEAVCCYTDERIVELLGLEARPPQPLGHMVDQGNITLIENVKNRGIAYREV